MRSLNAAARDLGEDLQAAQAVHGAVPFLVWKRQIIKLAVSGGRHRPKLPGMNDSHAQPELVAELTQRLHAFFSHLDNRRYDDVVNGGEMNFTPFIWRTPAMLATPEHAY